MTVRKNKTTSKKKSARKKTSTRKKTSSKKKTSTKKTSTKKKSTKKSTKKNVISKKPKTLIDQEVFDKADQKDKNILTKHKEVLKRNKSKEVKEYKYDDFMKLLGVKGLTVPPGSSKSKILPRGKGKIMTDPPPTCSYDNIKERNEFEAKEREWIKKAKKYTPSSNTKDLHHPLPAVHESRFQSPWDFEPEAWEKIISLTTDDEAKLHQPEAPQSPDDKGTMPKKEVDILDLIHKLGVSKEETADEARDKLFKAIEEATEQDLEKQSDIQVGSDEHLNQNDSDSTAGNNTLSDQFADAKISFLDAKKEAKKAELLYETGKTTVEKLRKSLQKLATAKQDCDILAKELGL